MSCHFGCELTFMGPWNGVLGGGQISFGEKGSFGASPAGPIVCIGNIRHSSMCVLQLLQVVLFAVSGVCCVVVTALLDVYAGCAETDDGEGVEVDTFLSDL